MLKNALLTAILCSTLHPVVAHGESSPSVQLGPRPFYLVDQIDDGELKKKLQSCSAGPFFKSEWSIGHRGAPMQFPEHTEEGYRAAARMGAGVIECDVTFTKDRQLVCRHAQNDLHTSTNILSTPLAAKCRKQFTPATGTKPASAECRASDLSLSEFRSLSGKMDAANKAAIDIEIYQNSTASWRTDLYSTPGTLVTHAQSIELIKNLGAKFTPELKSPAVPMPFEGTYTQAMYAQQMIDEYKAAGVPPSDVYPQSFNLEDVIYWIKNEPEFGKQAVLLDNSYSIDGWSPNDERRWRHSMAELKSMGVNYIAPPLWVLVRLENGRMVPSLYAEKAKEAGIKIIAWTVERSGYLKQGGGWYYKSVSDVIDNEGAVFELLHVLHQDVGVVGVFSDWPATTTFYANCFGLE